MMMCHRIFNLISFERERKDEKRGKIRFYVGHRSYCMKVRTVAMYDMTQSISTIIES